MALTASQADRAAGVLWGQACGDALGAGYEFGPPLAPDAEVLMAGGGAFGWAPGEWTDDTQMAVPLLVAAEAAVHSEDTLVDHLDDVAVAWSTWAHHAADVGNQTRSVLSALPSHRAPTSVEMLAASRALHARTGHTAGNGSLMRTSPVTLAYLGRDDALAAAARLVSRLTHYDEDAGDACVLWCLAGSLAVLTGDLDVRAGLAHLPAARRDLWATRIQAAEAATPVDFPHNGWVVHAFQAAWCALSWAERAPGGPQQRFVAALEGAVRAGRDTDTVAAITGQLAGAHWGGSAVPLEWQALIHGWPGLTGHDLAARGQALAEHSWSRPDTGPHA